MAFVVRRRAGLRFPVPAATDSDRRPANATLVEIRRASGRLVRWTDSRPTRARWCRTATRPARRAKLGTSRSQAQSLPHIVEGLIEWFDSTIGTVVETLTHIGDGLLKLTVGPPLPQTFLQRRHGVPVAQSFRCKASEVIKFFGSDWHDRPPKVSGNPCPVYIETSEQQPRPGRPQSFGSVSPRSTKRSRFMLSSVIVTVLDRQRAGSRFENS